MTRRTSTRALARDIYCEMAAALAHIPHSPAPAGQEQTGEEPSLTARVRALYEDSAMPVREIARVAGVTERTIYKYAAKKGWKPRYRWAPDRGWRTRATFAPAKGAGGRFIRRDDKGRPFATGLKATDAAGAARAAAECAQAERAERLAQVEAEKDALFETHMRAHAAMMRALDELLRYREEQAKLPPSKRAPADDALHHALHLNVEAAGDWWGASGREYYAKLRERDEVRHSGAG